MYTIRADNSKGGLGLDIGLCLGNWGGCPSPNHPYPKVQRFQYIHTYICVCVCVCVGGGSIIPSDYAYFYNWFLVIEKKNASRCQMIWYHTMVSANEKRSENSVHFDLDISESLYGIILFVLIPNHHHVISLTVIINESKKHCRILARAHQNWISFFNAIALYFLVHSN